MCECQGNPLSRVTLALMLPYLLVNKAVENFRANVLNSYIEFEISTVIVGAGSTLLSLA